MHSARSQHTVVGAAAHLVGAPGADAGVDRLNKIKAEHLRVFVAVDRGDLLLEPQDVSKVDFDLFKAPVQLRETLGSRGPKKSNGTNLPSL